MILSFLGMILSFFAFVVVTFAWLTISTQVDNSNIALSVDPGIIETSRFRIYAFDNVFQYDRTSNSLKVYSSEELISPTYIDPDDVAYAFKGIIINQYDPIIAENNFYNNIIIEIKLTYDVTANTTLNLTALSDTSIATEALAEFDPLDIYTDYYLSEVSNIQSLIYDAGASNPYAATAMDQMYNTFTTIFENTTTYPSDTFYTGVPETYTSSISFDDLSLVTTSSEPIYIYFNISYYESKIQSFLAFDPQNIDLENIAFIRFFQDITFKIKESVV